MRRDDPGVEVVPITLDVLRTFAEDAMVESRIAGAHANAIRETLRGATDLAVARVELRALAIRWVDGPTKRERDASAFSRVLATSRTVARRRRP